MAQVYQTAPNDTLWSIAQRFYGDGARWQLIYEANRGVIADPSVIQAGWNLTIPDQFSPPTGGTQSYTLQPGDTLWAVAQRFYGDGNKWSAIYDANRNVIGENPNAIQAGMTLTIPNSQVGNLPSGGATHLPSNPPEVNDVLSGTTWQWAKMTDPTQMVEIQNRANYTIGFSNWSQLSIRADCNMVNGNYRVGPNQTLSLTLGATTLAMCPPPSRGDEFTRKLSAVSRFYFQGNTLVLELMADGGTLEFTR